MPYYSSASRGLGEWIARTWEWSVFFTLTLADLPREQSYAGRTYYGVRHAEDLLQAWCSGSIEQRGGYWWAAAESHRDRATWHFHGIAGGFGAEPIRTAMWNEWRGMRDQGAGRAQVVPIKASAAVAVYVSKYVNKGLGKIYTGGFLELRKSVAFAFP
jgi:hypothetical protein